MSLPKSAFAIRAAKWTVLFGFEDPPRPKMAATLRRDETCAASFQ